MSVEPWLVSNLKGPGFFNLELPIVEYQSVKEPYSNIYSDFKFPKENDLLELYSR
jgi:hypothetical protein